MRHVMIAGPAASGKSTLGAALAAELGARLSDLDVVTREFIDGALATRAGDPGFDEAAALALFRDERYNLLAQHVRSLGPVSVVAVAPFTRELAEPAQWKRWVARAGWRPDGVTTVLIALDPSERYLRMAARGEVRDLHALGDGRLPASPEPAVPVVVVAGADPLHVQVAAVLQHFGNEEGPSSGSGPLV